MKPILTFILGAVLASAGVYYFASHRQPAAMVPPPVSTEPVMAPPAPVQATLPPEPEKPAEPTRVVENTAKPRPSKAAPVEKRPTVSTKPSPAPVDTTTSAPTEVARNTPPAPAPVTNTEPVAPTPSIEPKPEPRQPRTVSIPAGTAVSIRLDEALSTERSFQGDQFRATLDAPIVVDGLVIAEKGSRAMGRVVEIDKGGRVKGVAELGIELTQLNTADGQKIQLQTESVRKQANTERRKDAAKVGAVAGLGAIIGAIAGGGKGAAIGAGAGGAAGAGGIAATRGKAAEFPVESKITFRLRDSITITERLNR